jgi:membrane-associated phospholipid phosphatase
MPPARTQVSRKFADLYGVLGLLTAPLRGMAAVLGRVRYVIDESPLALSRAGRRLRWATAALLVAYGLFDITSGGITVLVGALVIGVAYIVLVGRMGEFIRDWAGVVVMILVYGSAFEVAAKLNMPTWYSPQIDADRVLGLGQIPTVWLQHNLHGSADGTLAVATALAYASHYYWPLALGVYIWWNQRDRGFFDLMCGYLVVLVLGTVVFVLAPTAPPWLASERGLLPPLRDVVKTGLLDLHLSSLAENARDPNLYLTRAAFPSIHAGWPVISLLVTIRHRLPRWVQGLALLQLVTVWFAIVYSGEHYVTDVIAGALVGVLAFALVIRYRERVTKALFASRAVTVQPAGTPETVVAHIRLDGAQPSGERETAPLSDQRR